MTLNELVAYKLHDDTPGDFTTSPAVAFFCFDSVDFDFEKAVIEEDIYSDVRKEKKDFKRGKTSSITGTVYKLTSEQKRCLKYLKRKYGKKLVKEIKQYRKDTLVPYQVAKVYNEKSKALYPKEVFGMTKEEYLKYKKSAESKIRNMRSNRYEDLNKEMISLYSKEKRLNDIDDFFGSHDISDTALNKVFKKYNIYSTKYTESEMRDFQKKVDNINKVQSDLEREIAKSWNITPEQEEKLKAAIKDAKELRADLSSKSDRANDNIRALKSLSRTIENIDDIPDELKDKLDDIVSGNDSDEFKITDKSFDQEYENFLLREKIRADIRANRDNKYTDDYRYNLKNVKDDVAARRNDTIDKMAKERASKTLTSNEKKIYELKPSAKKDSDRLEDYVLKIKEEDFFDPKYFPKDEKFKEAERKVDAAIKRFERSLETKMEEKDFQLLKKYRLISNLVTIKNTKLSDLFNSATSSESNSETNNEDTSKEENKN